MTLPLVITSGSLAKHTNRPHWAVEWVIRTRGFKPIAKAGNANVYSPEDGQRVIEELDLIEKRRQERRAGHAK